MEWTRFERANIGLQPIVFPIRLPLQMLHRGNWTPFTRFLQTVRDSVFSESPASFRLTHGANGIGRNRTLNFRSGDEKFTVSLQSQRHEGELNSRIWFCRPVHYRSVIMPVRMTRFELARDAFYILVYTVWKAPSLPLNLHPQFHGHDRNRTCYLLNISQMLRRLSYMSSVSREGFEPSIFGFLLLEFQPKSPLLCHVKLPTRVGNQGIEPWPAGCKPAILPLD